MGDLRVACIGAGYFAQFHYQAWAQISGVDLIASVDMDMSKARATGLAAYDNTEVMLRDAAPDIVDIITPPQTHFDLIKLALQSDVRAIICQKPFCRDLDEARRAADLARSAGVPLIIHENFRFQPWYRAIKQVLDEGGIGAVQQVTFRLRPGDGQGATAYLDRQPYFQKMKRFLVHETAVHWIDTFRYLLGDPASVFADLRRLNPVIAGEDAGYILFAWPDERRALFDGNRHLDHGAKNTRCTMGEALIEGTGGTLTLAGDGSVALRKFGAAAGTVIHGAEDWQGFGGDCVKALQTHVIAGLIDGAPFENMAHEYLHVLEIEEAVYRSAASKSWEPVSGTV